MHRCFVVISALSLTLGGCANNDGEDGGGLSATTSSTDTSATVQGFYFTGADDNAIQVHKDAGSRAGGKEQNICNCRFEG